MKHLLWLLFLSAPVYAQCPGEDTEPAIQIATAQGPTLFVCGFEDREVTTPKGKRAFSDFAIYFTTAKQTVAQKVFNSETDTTYWIKYLAGKDLELEELWFFGEKPEPAQKREITCTADSCVISEPKCILKLKKNPFPKALATFKKKLASGKLGDEGEDLIDQIFAEAFTGSAPAKEFFTQAAPAGLVPAAAEAFELNRKKLELGCK